MSLDAHSLVLSLSEDAGGERMQQQSRWIPAYAGMTSKSKGEGNAVGCHSLVLSLSEDAGGERMQQQSRWIPAYAGMTSSELVGGCGDDEPKQSREIQRACLR